MFILKHLSCSIFAQPPFYSTNHVNFKYVHSVLLSSKVIKVECSLLLSLVPFIIPVAEEAVAEAGPPPRALTHHLEHPPDDLRCPHVNTFRIWGLPSMMSTKFPDHFTSGLFKQPLPTGLPTVVCFSTNPLSPSTRHLR